MATDRLAQHRHAVVTLARRSATKAIKRQLQAQGVWLGDVTARDISIWADAWFDTHRDELIAEAKNTIATSPLFVQWRYPVFVKSTETEHSPNANTAIVGQIVND